MKMPKPCGTNILVEVEVVQKMSEGGIALPEDLVEKEQAVVQVGTVVAIGPCAYVDWAGCNVEGKTPAQCWGIDIGSKVEYKKFEGKSSVVNEKYRYIPDIHVIGVVQ